MRSHPGIDARLVTVFAVMAILTEFTGILTQVIGGKRRYDGPMGKSDRAFVWGVAGFIGAIGIPYGAWMNGVLGLSLLLMALTVVNRARHGITTP